MSGLDTSHRPGGGAWAAAVAVAEAAMVLMFSIKKSDEEEVFFCVGVSDFWAEWDNRYLFCNLSRMIFLGARKPAINPCSVERRGTN